MRERLSASPSDAIIKHLINPRLFGNLDPDFTQMAKVNRAHVVMLSETGIIPQAVGRTLLEGLGRLVDAGVQSIELDPDREDLHFNLEHALIADVGADVGGRLHTARSRNDLYATIQRMKVRGTSLHLSHLLLDLIEDVIVVARAEIATVMTGYTHGQPGQPITAGHYLSAISQALLRDAERVIAVFDRINLNPLGACALATTTYPIDRMRTADLLGFDGLVENSIDAVGSRDYVPELIFACSMPGTTISRLCADLHVWYTAEFNYIGIDDAIAGTSSIMPQKKNPSPIEHLKAKASHLYGALMTSLAAQRGAFYTHGREVGTESTSGLGEAVKQTEAMLELASSVVRGLNFRKDRLAQAASSNYSTLTELADAYVTDHGLSFRAAHQITGTVVRKAVADGLSGTNDINVEMVNAVASALFEDAPRLSEDELRRALDPLRSVERRKVRGGPAKASVSTMLEDQSAKLARFRAVLDARKAKLDAADERLDAATDALLDVGRAA